MSQNSKENLTGLAVFFVLNLCAVRASALNVAGVHRQIHHSEKMQHNGNNVLSLGSLQPLDEDHSLSHERSISPVYRRPKDDKSPRPDWTKRSNTANDTPSFFKDDKSTSLKSQHKHKKRHTVDSSVLQMNALSAKSRKEMLTKKRSYMHMTTKELQKECRKKRMVTRSLSMNPDRKEMVDILLLTEFGSEEKGKSNGSKKKKKDGVKRKAVKVTVTSVGEEEEENAPEFQRRTTWRSDAHITSDRDRRVGQLKKAHEKKSRRYDESLGMNIADDVMAALDMIDVALSADFSSTNGTNTTASTEETMERTITKRGKKQSGPASKMQGLKPKKQEPRRHSHGGSPNSEQPPLLHAQSVPTAKRGRKSNGYKKKHSAQKKAVKVTVTSVGEEEEEKDAPEFQRRTTWRSDAHITSDRDRRVGQLKKAHEKKSRRYDESLGMNIADDVMAALDMIDVALSADFSGTNTTASKEQTMDQTKTKRGKKQSGPASKMQGLKPKKQEPRRHSHGGSPNSEQPPLLHAQSVPTAKRGRARMREDAAKKNGGTAKQTSSVKRSCTSRKKKGASEDKMTNDTALPKMSTWRSDDFHKRRKGLKDAHEKKSYRYDEGLVVKNDRANALFSILNDIEVEKESRKKTLRMEKGRSLVGDELQAVEDDAMIDILAKSFDSKKRDGGKSIDRAGSFMLRV